ncbi:MAG: hypothetical protein QOH19_831 [Actinomycetota bacterium]|jgi:hypothetical protein|nr:hypothetical protein [Actinomycetota bacterium]
MKRDGAVAFNASSIDAIETDLRTAALRACWSYGLGTVNVNALADVGLEASSPSPAPRSDLPHARNC